MKKRFRIYIIILIAGFIIILLPDNDNRIISLNEHHGPSITDFIGITLIVPVWLLMLIESIKQYRKIYLCLKLQGLLICLLLVIGGSIWIAFSIDTSTNIQWVSGACIAIIGYAIPFYIAFKKD